jgi:FtsP/CotA-like multicopper oxidase with cupredoxin domain
MMKTRLAFIAFTLAASGAFAQQPCKAGEDLPKVPELVSSNGKLRATLIVTSEQQSIGTRVPNSAPTPGAAETCYPQLVRAMKGVNADPPYPKYDPNKPAEPLPGPTLRARVGELVELTFLNQIDMNNFPKSLDKGTCDAVTGIYPTAPGDGTDVYPNCFHGSVTANIHFHGTHVNPNSTGDNVFVEIRPSLRTRNAANAPLVTEASVKRDFDEFFARCEKELLPTNPVREWPFTWSDFPKHFTERQEMLLKLYDDTILGPNNKALWLWPVDAKQRAQGLWPQYYVGAYPYCYRIPMYTAATFPPPADTHAIHAAGAGTAENNQEYARPLVMGQAPGTHWYHAHKHGSTTIDVSNGMTGAFIIEGRYDEDLNAFYGRGWTRGNSAKVMVINQLGVSPNLERGGPGKGQDKGPTFTVNGRFYPVVKMRPGEVQMWRIVNTSSRAGAFFVGPPSGFQWKQLAQDGVQLVDANYQKSTNKPFLLAAGNRADFLVMAPAADVKNVPLMVQYEVDPQDLVTAAQNTLLTVTVEGDKATGNNAQFIPTAPTFPPFLADITDAEIKGTKTITFASQPPTLGAQHTIDGKQFGGEVGAVVLLNQAEEWKVVNETYGPAISHPFHIHVNPFQITEVFDPNAIMTKTAGAGTVSTSTNPLKVTGTGTSFTTSAHAGDQIWVTGERALTIVSVDSDTSLTVSGRISGVQNQSYLIAVPLYSFDKNNVQSGQCYVDPANKSSWHPCNPKVGTNLIWWDVFPIPSGKQVAGVKIPGYFKMRSRFVDYSGFYVLHCHILAHEDRGMMTIVEVAPLQSPYSHH